MMTLYVAFEAVENGEISLDKKIKISKKAASEPPSKLGLKAGQRITLRYLIRAAAIKSANDAATAIGEAIEGSEAAFARRMNRTAKALGMKRTTFKNAHGLTQQGHLSTARDMTILGRHVFYDYPEYYHLFSRRTANAGITKVRHTNTRFLANYRGADGIKTGFTSAAGYTLTASAERGNERIITTVFGGRSIATRNRQVAKLMDLGFKKAPASVRVTKPSLPNYSSINLDAKKITRPSGAVGKSLFPKRRPSSNTAIVAAVDLSTEIERTLKMLMMSSEKSENLSTPQVHLAKLKTEPSATISSVVKKETTMLKKVRLVSHNSSDEHKVWGVNVGRFGTRYAAEKMLIKTALAEMPTLGGSLRKVVKTRLGFEANFYGVSQITAEKACRKLTNRQISCDIIDPAG
jgi:D-alanyl-D-alanine carboxypeptidase